MADTLIENVSDTAFWIAHYRAVESARPDALFRDPLAALLAGEQGKKIARTMPMSFMTEWVVAIRTHIIDDYIRTAIAEGIDTVVNLGAGLDTRPYRMDLPEALQWIEVDYPRMIEFKERRLAVKFRAASSNVSLWISPIALRASACLRTSIRVRKSC